MKIYLNVLDAFDSEYQGKTYHIYQMLELKTMQVYTYSSEDNLPYKIGDTLLCEIGYRYRNKQGQIFVRSIVSKYEKENN